MVPSNVTGNPSAAATAQVAKVISWVDLQRRAACDSEIPIFLLVSDIIGFFGRPTWDQDQAENTQERHIFVAYPQCLGCYRTIRQSAAVVLIAWAIPFGILARLCLTFPLPPLLRCGLLESPDVLPINLPTTERRRTVWGIAAIWANYNLLYVPFIVSVLLEALCFKEAVRYLGLASHLLLYLSPLCLWEQQSHKAGHDGHRGDDDLRETVHTSSSSRMSGATDTPTRLTKLGNADGQSLLMGQLSEESSIVQGLTSQW
ncbi:hypothetical protein INR49_030653 [Caranx melampygus]|nr:hypothetical protein INR49_030653 [Caranx melampygus]